jgi:hypothetical protein
VLMCQPSASSAIECESSPTVISSTIIVPVMAMTIRVRRSPGQNRAQNCGNAGTGNDPPYA